MYIICKPYEDDSNGTYIRTPAIYIYIYILYCIQSIVPLTDLQSLLEVPNLLLAVQQYFPITSSMVPLMVKVLL